MLTKLYWSALLFEAIFILFAILIASFSYWVGRAKFYWPLNPLFVFVASFVLIFCVFVAMQDRVNMSSPSSITMFLLGLQLIVVPSCLLFLSPNTSQIFNFKRANDGEFGRPPIPRLFLSSLVILGLIALFIFALYIKSNNIVSGNIIKNLNLQRLRISQGIKPEFFYWFYLAEILPPIFLMACWEFRVKRSLKLLLFFLGALCVLSLFFTGAKVNFIKPIKFILIIYLLKMWQQSQGVSLRSIFTLSIITIIPISLLVGFMIFTGDKANLNVAVENIALRFSAQIAALDEVFNHSSPYYLGQLTILPVSKALSVFGFIDGAPRHILPFYNIPFPWNVATYLEVGYRDFGYLGAVFIQFYFGFFIATFLWVAKYLKTKSLSLILFILMTNFCFSAISIAPIIKPIYWFQIFLVISLDLISRIMTEKEKKPLNHMMPNHFKV